MAPTHGALRLKGMPFTADAAPWLGESMPSIDNAAPLSHPVVAHWALGSGQNRNNPYWLSGLRTEYCSYKV